MRRACCVLAALGALALAGGCSHHGAAVPADQTGSFGTFTMQTGSVSNPPVPPNSIVFLEDRYADNAGPNASASFQTYTGPTTFHVGVGTKVLVELDHSWERPTTSDNAVLTKTSSTVDGVVVTTTFTVAAKGQSTVTADWGESCNGNTRACPAARQFTIDAQ